MFRHRVLPIVMGARPEDYARLAPAHSYIHVDQFRGPEQLAAYLHQLDQDDAAYNQYFQVRLSSSDSQLLELSNGLREIC